MAIREMELNLGQSTPRKIREMDVPDQDHSIPGNREDLSATEQIMRQVRQQEIKTPEYRPQIQEEFSNPTAIPGFEQLPKEEQLKRIQLSLFDPANVSPTGTIMPPGAYESPITRGAYSILPTLAAPQISGGASILGREALAPIFNALSRVGAGTAGNIAFESPQIKNMQDLKNIGLNSLQMNALLEGATLPFRIPAHLAETFNPLKFGEQKASQINNEFRAAKALQENTYRPVFDKYGDFNVTLDSKKYMENLGIEKKGLYHQTKELYDNFIKDPNFNNLHKFQSQLGTDLRQTRIAGTKPATVSKFSVYHNKLKDKVENYLKNDPEMLKQYEKGSRITRDLVEPYRATPTLEKIAYGKKENTHPEMMSNAIKKANEKIVARKGEEAFTAIPREHPLQNHLQDLDRIMNFGKFAKVAIPTAAGAIGGHFVAPGMGSLAGGAGGAGMAATLLSNIGNPVLQATVQNPFIENIFRKLSPAYYAGGRAYIGERGK